MSRSQRPRSAGTLTFNLALTLASAAVTIVALEGGTRLLGLKGGFFLRPNVAQCEQRSALMTMEFIPDCDGKLGETPFHINSLGLRSPELREDDSIRILAIGDSCTWGWGVPDGEPYPAALQRVLDARAASPRFDVINAGIPGNTSYEGYLYLRERGLALHPGIVIVAYGFNDQLPSGDVEVQLARMKRWSPLLRLDDLLIDFSAFYRWARWTGDQKYSWNGPARVAPEKYRHNLTQIVELSRTHGSKVLLLTFGGLPGKEAARPADGQPYAEATQAVADELALPVLAYDGPRLDIVHPTAVGYRKLAGEIARKLEETGYIDRAR